MMRIVAFVLLLSGPALSAADQASVTPVQKVIQMLGDMLAKSKEEMQDEQVAWAEFSTFCKNEQAAKANEISEEKEQIEALGAAIMKANADAAQLGKEIADLNNELDQNTATLKAQTEERKAENEENMAALADYDESLDAIDRAINVLSKQNFDRKQDAASLIQLSSSTMLPQRAKQLIKVFLQMEQPEEGEEGYMGYEAPEANAYEFQSGGIIDMLKGLKDKFRKERGDLEKAEMNSKHAFNMMKQDLTDSIDRANKAIGEKGAEKSAKHESAANDSKEKAATEADLAEDEKYLSDLKAECEQKAKSFEEKQQLRKDEIEAISKAIDILSSGAVSGAAEKHLPGALTQEGVSLAQFRSTHKQESVTAGIHARLTEFLNSESRRLHSKSLAFLAEKIGADPFAKVKKMIDEMITRLLEEANADAEQKGFCDKELGTNKITRDKLSSDIEKLQSEIEEAEATIAKLGEEITELTAGVEELDKAMAEATAQREKEKAKNTQTIEDAVGAQKAVDAAVAVLKDFYEKAAQATALVQTGSATETKPKGSLLSKGIAMGSDEWNALGTDAYDTMDKGHKEGMQTFGETYKGQQDEAGGVLAMLEVILSDFANLEADTKAAEHAAEKAYTDFMNDAKQDKAVKLKSIEMKTADKQATEKKHNQDVKDMKATQDELLAADRYYEKLKPQCVDKGVVTYEERVAAREAEIQSLREALKILSGSDIA